MRDTVTAHDFYDEFHAHNDLPGVFFPDECEKGIEALLSQVRAQAREEALNGTGTILIYRGNPYASVAEIAKEAHAEGRREGLREMDIAHNNLALIGNPLEEVYNDRTKLSNLRQEYQSPA